MIGLLRNIERFFSNIYHHRIALWNSVPWDSTGVYLMIMDNLRYLSASIEKYGNHRNKGKQVKDMRICISLLDRLVKDDYSKAEYDLDTTASKGFTIIVTNKHDLPKVCRGYAHNNDHKWSEKLKNADKELLFKILRRNMESWWD